MTSGAVTSGDLGDLGRSGARLALRHRRHGDEEALGCLVDGPAVDDGDQEAATLRSAAATPLSRLFAASSAAGPKPKVEAYRLHQLALVFAFESAVPHEGNLVAQPRQL